jgi:hypothetical protein
MRELFPVASGVLLGFLVGVIRPSLRLPVAFGLTILLGVAATVLSGEYRISWEFLVIDVPMVGICATVTLLAGRAVGRRSSA